MNKILFTSTLFFNKVGNQSLLETIKEYAKYYEVHFVTSSSDQNDYYLSFPEAREKLPDNVYLYRTPQFFHTFFRTIAHLFKTISRKENKSSTIADSDLINLRYTFFNVLSFKAATFVTCLYVSYLKFFKRLAGVQVVCAYEIGTVKDSLFIKRYLFPKACLMAKMQGTVLMPILQEKELTEELRKKYILDVAAYQRLSHFDLVTMTNDGTKGDEVLKYFGVEGEKIIFLMNGVSGNILNHINDDVSDDLTQTPKIRLCTISRLVGWKRVYLSVELMNRLVNDLSFKNAELVIYGKGTESEVNYIEKLVADYRLEDYVRLVGEIKHELVPHVMKSNDFIISLYKYTNVTNPLLEAVFLGSPVITLSDNSLNRILQNDPKKNIFIFEEKDGEMKLVEEISNFIFNVDIQQVRNRRKELQGCRPETILSWTNRVEIETTKIRALCSNS